MSEFVVVRSEERVQIPKIAAAGPNPDLVTPSVKGDVFGQTVVMFSYLRTPPLRLCRTRLPRPKETPALHLSTLVTIINSRREKVRGTYLA